MEQQSQSTCWKLVENLRHQKGQEKSPHNQVGWKKGKKKKLDSDQAFRFNNISSLHLILGNKIQKNMFNLYLQWDTMSQVQTVGD